MRIEYECPHCQARRMVLLQGIDVRDLPEGYQVDIPCNDCGKTLRHRFVQEEGADFRLIVEVV